MTMDARTSVLAKLTASVMEEKRAAKRALTPVAGEVVTPEPPPQAPLDGTIPGVPFPYDHGDLIGKALADARRDIEFVLKGIESLETYFGKWQDIATGDTTSADIVKEKEREADARIKAQELADFNADFEAKQKAAQEAVFGEDEPEWVCPDHGKSVTKTSSKGREFLGCPECNKFQR